MPIPKGIHVGVRDELAALGLREADIDQFPLIVSQFVDASAGSLHRLQHALRLAATLDRAAGDRDFVGLSRKSGYPRAQYGARLMP